MEKYNYDQSLLSGLSIKPFLNEVAVRNAKIEAAAEDMPPSDYAVNQVARALHPDIQFGLVSKVTAAPGKKIFTIIPDQDRGTRQLATFRAGQFVVFALEIDGQPTTRPYHLCGSPKDVYGENGHYTFIINDIPGRKAGPWICEHWQEGTRLMFSGPLGELYYQSLRDGTHVVGIGSAGPFLSMGKAIADGLEDFCLTIVSLSVGSKDEGLRAVAEDLFDRSGGKVHFFEMPLPIQKSDQTPLVTVEMLKKWLPHPEDTSLFLNLPSMIVFDDQVKSEAIAAGVQKRRIRKEYSGGLLNPFSDPAYPEDHKGQIYGLTLRIHGREQVVPCSAGQTLMEAIEAAGVSVPADCRSGQCGWCSSRLISGEVFIPASHDGRRAAHKKFNWIHPCVTYPLSDIAVEVFPF